MNKNSTQIAKTPYETNPETADKSANLPGGKLEDQNAVSFLDEADGTKTEKAALPDNADLPCSPAADTAEAENKDDVTASATGKFKDVHALMAAYLSLEAEFTRRSQRLKELEASKAKEAPSPVLTEEQLTAAALSDEKIKNAVIGEYLKGVFAGKTVPLTVGGVPLAAPECKPRSVKEAGALAKEFLKQ